MIGLIIGLAVVGQPILKEYFDCPLTCEIKKDQESQKSEKEDQKSIEQISTLEAVTPVSQVQQIATDFFILNILSFKTEEAKSQAPTFNEKIPVKLLKVLFNIIIAPNAP